MRILQNIPVNYKISKPDYSQKNVSNPISNEIYPAYNYPAIYFTGNFNPQKYTPSRINLTSAKSELISKFDDILKNDVTDAEMTKEEKHLQALTRVTGFENWKARRLSELDLQCVVLVEKIQMMSTKGISAQSIMNERNALLKEYNKLDKMKTPPPPKQKPINPNDAKTDFVLINKFKSAVMDDNFDLRQVYMDHFSGLNDIKTIRELKQTYPKIEIPVNPKVVVAKKIEGCLTRDFYEELDKLHNSGDPDAPKVFIEEKVKSILSEQLKKSTPETKKEIERKLVQTTTTHIGRRYKKLKETGSFTSVPYARKIKYQILSDTDKKLLTLDYNDFVLSVIREQYLGQKKPNDIVYKYNKGKPGHRVEHTLKVSELANSDYKFPKISEKLKNLLSYGDELKFTQRNYDYFTKEDFINRLEFHADRQEPNEKFLDTIINFSSCLFEGEDIDMVKKFLREADNALDGKKKVKDVVEFVDINRIRPSGTEKINEAERQERIAKIKAEQKQHAKLAHIQRSFDDNINIMYTNNMAYTAEMCSAYRPESIDSVNTAKAEYISKITKKYLNPENEKEIINKDRMATELTRWKKYMEYAENDIDKKLLEKSQNFARKENGEIDYDKAGKYLINYEAINTYPASFEYATNREAAETIMAKFAEDKDKAVEYLCKYDDYLDLSDKEKTKISNILNIFDKKEELDSDLLKSIIKNEYVKTATTDWAKQDEKGSKKVLATIAPEAKSQILDFYKFPNCLNYFEAFEAALPFFASKHNSPGIKKIDKNYYELKIKGHTDRLLAENGDYIFNKFDETGLH